MAGRFSPTIRTAVSLFDRDPRIQAVAKRYPYRQPLVGMDMVYYSDRPIRAATSN